MVWQGGAARAGVVAGCEARIILCPGQTKHSLQCATGSPCSGAATHCTRALLRPDLALQRPQRRTDMSTTRAAAGKLAQSQPIGMLGRPVPVVTLLQHLAGLASSRGREASIAGDTICAALAWLRSGSGERGPTRRRCGVVGVIVLWCGTARQLGFPKQPKTGSPQRRQSEIYLLPSIRPLERGSAHTAIFDTRAGSLECGRLRPLGQLPSRKTVWRTRACTA